jgi:flagellin
MSLRINTNTDALDAYRNLSTTQSNMSSSLEKLSSGFRINKAADDASGLSISEGLQAQIGGLSQAVSNAQDGINVVQTADGALTEVDSILQRMNDLAVQASNTGSQDTNARTAAQTELTQLNADLDNIGNTTEFGQSHLLDGTFGVQGANTSTAASGNAEVTLSGIGTGASIGLSLQEYNNSTTPATAITGTASVSSSAVTGTYTDDAAGAAKLQADLNTSLQGGNLAGKVTASVKFDNLTGKASVSFQETGAANPTGATFKADGTTALTTADTLGATNTNSFGITSGTKGTASGKGGVFQIGSNAGQTQTVSIAAVNSTTLGTNALDLVNDPSDAITAIQAAITSVSTTRSQLGAYQNGFQHTINNLNVTVENLQSSNSSIMDTDMASEMVNFTQQQVLEQAGVSMLSQANSESQSVLKLLQG